MCGAADFEYAQAVWHDQPNTLRMFPSETILDEPETGGTAIEQ
jgi:hypothetical protein